MLRFGKYLNEDYLVESLNNPQEYYITDDTKIPERIYASFSVDGNPYIIALLESNVPGIYTLEVGRTKEGASKTYWWKYHNSSDIMSVLATLLQFTQSSMAWTQGKIKGVVVKFRAAQTGKIDRAVKIAERIVKKAYVKSFKLVSVKQPAEDSVKNKERYLFVAKKTIDPKALFKSKSFAGYDFDGKELDVELIEPKKTIKPTTTLKQSTKYSFGDYAVSINDEEIFDKIEKISAEKPETPAEQEKPIEMPTVFTKRELAGMLAAIPIFESLIGKLKKYGFDESKLNWGDFEYVLGKATKKQNEILLSAGISKPLSEDAKTRLKGAMEWISTNTDSAVFKTVKAEVEEWLAADEIETNNINLADSLDLSSLVSTIPGVSTTKPSEYSGVWDSDGEYDVYTARSYIDYDLGFYDKLQKIPNLATVKNYTGSAYAEGFNNPLRKTIGSFFEGNKIYPQQVDMLTKGNTKIGKLSKFFNKIEPFPEPIWVYRGFTLNENDIAKYINVGEDYVDPAFLSTSLNPKISFGMNIRMRIYVPKNSKIIPILSQSNHSSEHEVILPSCSVIRILGMEKVGSRYFVTGALIGSAFNSIIESMKSNMVTEGYIEMNEQDNDKYDPEGKFGGNMSVQMSKKITDAIKSGKVKVDKPKKK